MDLHCGPNLKKKKMPGIEEKECVVARQLHLKHKKDAKSVSEMVILLFFPKVLKKENYVRK